MTWNNLVCRSATMRLSRASAPPGLPSPTRPTTPGWSPDCEALLASRDTLAGTVTLNWSVDIPVADWDGITLEGTSQRVTRLSLVRRGLNGEIPPELGDLTNLERLALQLNRLSGEIPVELGNLANLHIHATPLQRVDR